MKMRDSLGENQIINRWTLFVLAMTDQTASYLIMWTCSSSPSRSALFGVSGVSAGRPIRGAEVSCLFLLAASRVLSLLFPPLLLSSSERHQTKCFSWNVSQRYLFVHSQPSVFIAGFIFPRWSSFFFLFFTVSSPYFLLLPRTSSQSQTKVKRRHTFLWRTEASGCYIIHSVSYQFFPLPLSRLSIRISTSTVLPRVWCNLDFCSPAGGTVSQQVKAKNNTPHCSCCIVDSDSRVSSSLTCLAFLLHCLIIYPPSSQYSQWDF